jgi:Protein of unknown function (DUF2829)
MKMEQKTEKIEIFPEATGIDEYTPGVEMAFGEAVELLKKEYRTGTVIYRRGWHKSGMFLIIIPENVITLYTPGNSICRVQTREYVALVINGVAHPWNASQTDFFTKDWCSKLLSHRYDEPNIIDPETPADV